MRRLRIALATSGLLLGVLAAPIARGGEGWNIPEEAAKRSNPHPATDETLAAAKAVYEKKCSVCHGMTGDGKGKIAIRMGIHPTPFTDEKFMDGFSDGELFYKVTKGRDPMPSFETKLSEEDRWKLVHYIRTLSAPENTSQASD